MKKITLTITLVLINVTVASAQFSVASAKTYGGPGNDDFTAMKNTTDGGLIMVGSSGAIGGDINENGGCTDIWLVKTDLDGNLLWQKSLPFLTCDYATDICPTSDNGYVIIGDQFDEEIAKTTVIKLDSELNTEWQYNVSGNGTSPYGRHIAEASDGGFIFTGVFSDGWNPPVTFVYKLDSAGAYEWDITEDATGGSINLLKCSDGNFLITESSEYLPENYTPKLTKIDSQGEVIWSEIHPDYMYFHILQTIVETSDGGFIGVTKNYADTSLFYNTYLVKFSAAGALQWIEENTASPMMESTVFISELANGGYLGAGFSNSASGDDIYVFQANASGTIIQDDIFGGSLTDQTTAAIYDNGQLLIAGATTSADGDFEPANGATEAFFMKLDVTLSATDHQLLKPRMWPNPAKAILNFESAETFLEASIIDVTGKEISQYNADAASIDVSKLESGIYFLKLASQGNTYIEKFIKN